MIGLLFPAAVWVLGWPFEGRHAYGYRLAHTAVPELVDWALLAVLAVHGVYGIWLVWYAAGLRWIFLLLVGLELMFCGISVWGDFLWSAGPP